MKLNPRKIEVESNPEIHKALVSLFCREDKPEIIIESGTYKGTGTTKTVIDAVLDAGIKPEFYTIEALKRFYGVARENLKEYDWVYPINGFSVKIEDAIDFMENDYMMNNHKLYPNIYMDTSPEVDSLVPFYSKGINEMARDTQRESVLVDLINQFKDEKRLMIILDSDGGIGFLEFKTVLREMENRGFFLFMDDAQDHIKHYRSGIMVKGNHDNRWKILFQNDRIMIAERLGK